MLYVGLKHGHGGLTSSLFHFEPSIPMASDHFRPAIEPDALLVDAVFSLGILTLCVPTYMNSVVVSDPSCCSNADVPHVLVATVVVIVIQSSSPCWCTSHYCSGCKCASHSYSGHCALLPFSWPFCLQCMSEGEKGHIATTLIKSMAVSNVGGPKEFKIGLSSGPTYLLL